MPFYTVSRHLPHTQMASSPRRVSSSSLPNNDLILTKLCYSSIPCDTVVCCDQQTSRYSNNLLLAVFSPSIVPHLLQRDCYDLLCFLLITSLPHLLHPPLNFLPTPLGLLCTNCIPRVLLLHCPSLCLLFYQNSPFPTLSATRSSKRWKSGQSASSI